MSRNYVLSCLLTMVIGGAMFGIAIWKCFITLEIYSLSNLSICILAYTIFCIFCWLPLIVPMLQIMDVDEKAVYLMPRYSGWKKMTIAWYALINDNIRPFYRVIPLESIDHITFTYEAHWGSYAYQRFTYILIYHIKDEKIRIYINPQQNGFLLPSGYGLAFAGTLSREDIVNQMNFYRTNHINIKDPYKLCDALKDGNIVMYDYLVSLNKKITY